MPLNNPKTMRNGSDITIPNQVSPEAAERKMRLATEGELGAYSRFRVGLVQSRLARETSIQLAQDNAQATREIGKTAIELNKQQVKLGLVAGNINAIAALQGNLFDKYAIAGEDMLTSQAVATKSLIESRAHIKNSLLAEGKIGHLSEKETEALLDDVDERSAEQEIRLLRVAEACQENLASLTLSVVQQMKNVKISEA